MGCFDLSPFLLRACPENVETELIETVNIDPIPMTHRCRDVLQRGADRTGTNALIMHFGAGHDSMHIATVTDDRMLFAPSEEGISHNPAEWTDWEDCARATAVLATALVDLATNTRSD